MNKVLISIFGVLLTSCSFIGLCNECYYLGVKDGARQLRLMEEQYNRGKLDGIKECTKIISDQLRII